MAERLHPCAACARHVLCSERACPFCGAAIAVCSASPGSLSEPFRRMTAAAAVAAGGAALTGCSSGGTAVPLYGGAGEGAYDSGSGDVGGGSDDSGGSGIALYGGPFFDGSVARPETGAEPIEAGPDVTEGGSGPADSESDATETG